MDKAWSECPLIELLTTDELVAVEAPRASISELETWPKLKLTGGVYSERIDW